MSLGFVNVTLVVVSSVVELCECWLGRGLKWVLDWGDYVYSIGGFL